MVELMAISCQVIVNLKEGMLPEWQMCYVGKRRKQKKEEEKKENEEEKKQKDGRG